MVSSSTALGLGCNKRHPWPSGVLEETKWFLLFWMCHWTMGLNSDKTSKVFLCWYLPFSTRFHFLYHSGTIIQVSSKLWMFLISTPHETKTFTVRLAVTTNTKETVLQQMCCLDPKVVPIGPIVRGVIAFPILVTWWDATTQVASQSVHWQASYSIWNIFQQRPSAILNFKNFNIWSVTVNRPIVQICCCIPNFIKIGSRVRPPDAHNCWMSGGPLQGNSRCHGNRIMAYMSGTWCDATTQVASQSVNW